MGDHYPHRSDLQWSAAELKALPTIEQGHTDNLKFENPIIRVWLSRMTIEDGMPYNDQVTVERRLRNGIWTTVAAYQARDEEIVLQETGGR